MSTDRLPPELPTPYEAMGMFVQDFQESRSDGQHSPEQLGELLNSIGRFALGQNISLQAVAPQLGMSYEQLSHELSKDDYLAPLLKPADQPEVGGISSKESEVPRGFSERRIITKGAKLKSNQFEGLVHSLRESKGEYELDAELLVTDSGKKVLVCDMHPEMTSQVRSDGPESEKQREALDALFLEDVKFMLETGAPKNTVTQKPKIAYTKLGGTKVRSFWMVAANGHHDAAGMPTIVRLADNRNSVQAEKDLHKRLLKI